MGGIMSEQDAADTSSNALLNDCAELCDTARQLFHAHAVRTRWIPTASSPAADQMIAARAHVGPDGRWDDHNIQEVSALCPVYLFGATQHLASIAALLRAGLCQLHPGPSARAVAEWSARVIWLLDPRLTYDEGLAVGTRKRVARVLLDKEHDARLRKDVGYKLDASDRAKWGDEWKAAKNRVRKPSVFRADEISLDKHGDVTLCGEHLAGPGELVVLAGKIVEYDSAGAQYSYLSSMGHPTIYAVMETVEWYEDENGDVQARDAMSLPGIAILATNAVAAFYAGWRLLTIWLGHKETELASLSQAHALLTARITPQST